MTFHIKNQFELACNSSLSFDNSLANTPRLYLPSFTSTMNLSSRGPISFHFFFLMMKKENRTHNEKLINIVSFTHTQKKKYDRNFCLYV